MAHLDDRGQIILVAAFALGVIFIALAVVVNAAIFTENLATRGSATGGGDALNYRHEVEQNVGHVIEYINTESDGGTNLTEAAIANITNISRQGGRQKARLGRIVTVEYIPGSIETGTRFVNRSGTYESNNSDSTWTVAQDVTQTRGFVLNISDPSALSSSRGNAFNVSVFKPLGGPYWNMTVYKPAGGLVKVTVNNSDGDVASCAKTVSGQFTVDVTGGTVAGEPCHALTISDGNSMWFASAISSGYDIRFINAHKIEGGYEGVIKDGSLLNLPLTSDSHDAIYSLEVRYVYHTPTIHYRTDIRVAPGEPES